MNILRQDSFQHQNDYPFYTLCEHEVFSDDDPFLIKCYTIICEYGVHRFNIMSYADRDEAERVFDKLVDDKRYQSA